MKKNPLNLILILLAVILLVGFLVYKFVLSKPSGIARNENGDSTKTTQANKNDDEESISGSILDILKMGKSVKCSGKFESEDGEMTLLVYTSGTKSYQEMEVKTKEVAEESEESEDDMEGVPQDMKNYSIYDGETYYMWDPETKEGTKMKISSMESLAEDFKDEIDSAKQDDTANQNIAQKINYKCLPWIVDQGKFNPPKDVTFTDLSESMKEFTEGLKDIDLDEMRESACKSCDLIKDEAKKAECKESLECE